MLKNVPISLSGPVTNIKLVLKLCHFDGYNNLMGHGPAIFYISKLSSIMIFIT